MGFEYADLDRQTRDLMVQELESDLLADTVYVSKRLTPEGKLAWPGLLKEAALEHDDNWLAGQLLGRRYLVQEGRFPNPELLTEGEFNRYYVRAICLRALAGGWTEVLVVRGRLAMTPRPESEALVGSHLPAAALLGDLRTSQGKVPRLRVGVPNSHLTVRLLEEP